MNIDELVRNAKLSAPGLRGLADDDACRLLRAVFRKIRDKLDTIPLGELQVAALGVFRIRQVLREENAKKTRVRQVVFQPSEPKATTDGKITG